MTSTVVPVKRYTDTNGMVICLYGTVVCDIAFENHQLASAYGFTDTNDGLSDTAISPGDIGDEFPHWPVTVFPHKRFRGLDNATRHTDSRMFARREHHRTVTDLVTVFGTHLLSSHNGVVSSKHIGAVADIKL